jgi:glycine oxidase
MAGTRPLPPRSAKGLPDVVVVGSGLIGLATAFQAASRGLEVVLLDFGRAGMASAAAAGLIAPSLGALPPPAQRAFDEARELFEPFVGRVSAASGNHVDVQWGLLEVASDAEEWRELTARRSDSAQPIDRTELAGEEPALAGAPGALLHLRDGWVDPRSLVSALGAAVDGQPGVERRTELLVEISVERNSMRLMLESGAILRAPTIVIAAGAWTKQIRGLRELPVEPVKGQLISLRAPFVLRHAVAGVAGYAVPRGEEIIIGSTMEHTGFDAEPTVEGRQMLLEAAGRLLPGVEHLGGISRTWAGLRPMTPDRLPLIGPLDDAARIVVATGHGKNGVLLAPFTALAITSILLSEPVPKSLSSFIPTRFDSPTG